MKKGNLNKQLFTQHVKDPKSLNETNTRAHA